MCNNRRPVEDAYATNSSQWSAPRALSPSRKSQVSWDLQGSRIHRMCVTTGVLLDLLYYVDWTVQLWLAVH